MGLGRNRGSVTILRTSSILLCRRLVLLCCAVLGVSLLASAEAESAVTRAEVRWSWSSNPSGVHPSCERSPLRGA